jgi:antitoxin VapB
MEIYAYGHSAQRGYSGRGTAMRRDCRSNIRLNSEEVEIFRRGDEIILREKDGTAVRAFDLLAD